MAVATVTPDQDSIISEVEIAAPPERVFQALSDPKQLIQWWNSERCPCEGWQFDARPGGKWHASFKGDEKAQVNYGIAAFDHKGEILEIDPPRLLVYSWFANFHEDPAIRNVVRWELTATGQGTKVKVTHSGLSKLPKSRKDYAGGWPGVVAQLKAFAEKG